MVRLKAPADHTSVSFQGVEYPVDDGHVEVPETAESVLRSHGYVRPEDAPEAAEPSEDPDRMGRNEMFAFLKGRGVAVTLPVTNDRLREIVRETMKAE